MKDNAILAIGFAALNAFMLAGMSLSAKWLGEYFGAIEVTFWRNLASVLFLCLWFVVIRKFDFWKTSRPIVHVFRSFVGTVGIILGMYTVSVLSLAETTVLLFTSPLFTVTLSAIILREKVGFFRIAAVLIGFLGVGIIAAPGLMDASHALPILALMTGLGWGFCSGSVDVVLRWMGRTESSFTTVFYFLLFGSISCAFYWPFSATPIDSIEINQWPQVLVIIGLLGATGTLGLLAKTQSYRLGEASMIAPIMYTMLIWALVFDYIFWGRVPTWNVVLGAVIIIGANLFILYREHLKGSVKAEKQTQGCAD